MAKITLEKISEDLLDIDDNALLLDDFVAIGIQLDDNGVGKHSVISIGVKKEYYIFHFGGSKVDLDPVPDGQKYYIKYINDLIDPEYALSFLAHCKQILKSPPPSYGHIFRKAYYDYDGKLYSDDDITNFATCVGFCINAVTLFVDAEEYFDFTEWTAEEMAEFNAEHTWYFDKFYEKFSKDNPGVDSQKFNTVYKRITPSEYTASAYLATLPIKKNDIDIIISDVKQALKNKVGAA